MGATPTRMINLSAWDEKSILAAALAIMAKQLGRPCGFRALLDPGTSSVEIVFRPPSKDDKRGYIGAALSSGPLPGEAHERHSDLPDGNYTRQTLEIVIEAIRDEIERNLA